LHRSLFKKELFPKPDAHRKIALENLTKIPLRFLRPGASNFAPGCFRGKEIKKRPLPAVEGFGFSSMQEASRAIATSSEASPPEEEKFLSGRNPNSKRAQRARFFFLPGVESKR
jgi:hypothetical protein